MADQPTNSEDGPSFWRQGDNRSSGQTMFSRITNFISEEATFFRIHLAAFTIIPLIFSWIFYASNGRFHVSFLDSMFLCYSAMTVTGLSTVNLSTITAWQQVILYILMTIVSSPFWAFSGIWSQRSHRVTSRSFRGSWFWYESESPTPDIFPLAIHWRLSFRNRFRRFFRTYCEYIVAKRRRQPTNKWKASMKDTISSPITTFKQSEAVYRQEREIGPTIGTANPEPPQVFSSSPKSVSRPLSALSESVPVRSPAVAEFTLSTTISPRPAHYHPMMAMRSTFFMVT